MPNTGGRRSNRAGGEMHSRTREKLEGRATGTAGALWPVCSGPSRSDLGTRASGRRSGQGGGPGYGRGFGESEEQPGGWGYWNRRDGARRSDRWAWGATGRLLALPKCGGSWKVARGIGVLCPICVWCKVRSSHPILQMRKLRQVPKVTQLQEVEPGLRPRQADSPAGAPEATRQNVLIANGARRGV